MSYSVHVPYIFTVPVHELVDSTMADYRAVPVLVRVLAVALLFVCTRCSVVERLKRRHAVIGYSGLLLR